MSSSRKKKCRTCGKVKHLDEFWRRKIKLKDGSCYFRYPPDCATCSSKKQRGERHTSLKTTEYEQEISSFLDRYRLTTTNEIFSIYNLWEAHGGNIPRPWFTKIAGEYIDNHGGYRMTRSKTRWTKYFWPATKGGDQSCPTTA